MTPSSPSGSTPSGPRVVNVGGVPIIFGNWFSNAAEANEWLSFDAGSDEIDYHANAEPDHFAEWERWRADAATRAGDRAMTEPSRPKATRPEVGSPAWMLKHLTEHMLAALLELDAAGGRMPVPGKRRPSFTALQMRGGGLVNRLPVEDGMAVFEITDYGRDVAREGRDRGV